MKINSSKTLFLTTMILGIVMSISSNNWVMIWCGLEISLVSIIPLMINKSTYSSESMMKYFIVQSISSSVLMLGLMTMIMKGDYNYGYILATAIMIKLGVAPFHNWVLTVLEGLDYYMVLIMLTVNKIAPITMMSYLNSKLSFIMLITAAVGAVMGINQSSMKKIIGYSSVFNMAFILAIIKYTAMWTMYLIVYSVLIFYLLMYMNKQKISFLNQISFSEMFYNKISLWMSLLSLGGMPPLIGFSIKYMVMVYMTMNNLTVMMILMVMMSLMVMFYYMRMTFTTMMSKSIIQKNKLIKLNVLSSWILIFNTITMPAIMISKTLII